MIVLVITSEDLSKVEKVGSILHEERLGIDINLNMQITRLDYDGGVLEKHQLYQLTAKTKALLFPRIDKRIRDEFGDEIPEIYSLPIVHMDWSQTEQLVHHVETV